MSLTTSKASQKCFGIFFMFLLALSRCIALHDDLRYWNKKAIRGTSRCRDWIEMQEIGYTFVLNTRIKRFTV